MKFECESVTPMFMSGADPRQCELRPPSFKGAIRFWWRAMNGHLPLSELRRKESELFGDSGEIGKSNIIVKLKDIENIETVNISLTPHHRLNYCNKYNKNCSYKNNKCAKANLRQGMFYKFNFIIKVNKSIEEKIISLVKLIFALGGFGKRSRRGFGSVKINKINDKPIGFIYNNDYIIDTLNQINRDSFEVKENKIVRKYQPDSEARYGYIEHIQIGKQFSSYKDILIKIGECTHQYRDSSLGFSSNGRLSSPVYVSVIQINEQHYCPIITTLNTVFGNKCQINTAKQEAFKEAILT